MHCQCFPLLFMPFSKCFPLCWNCRLISATCCSFSSSGRKKVRIHMYAFIKHYDSLYTTPIDIHWQLKGTKNEINDSYLQRVENQFTFTLFFIIARSKQEHAAFCDWFCWQQICKSEKYQAVSHIKGAYEFSIDEAAYWT